jgi:hypothetical protein
LNAIHDIAELQKSEAALEHSVVGEVRLRCTVELYGKQREYCYTVIDVPRNRSRVRIEVFGVAKGKEALCFCKQFALLESMMVFSD